MTRCNLEEIINNEMRDIKNYIAQEEALIKTLEGIKIKKTKKGEYFKNINKGLEGATFKKSEIGFGGESELEVCYSYEETDGRKEYIIHSIYLYKSLDDNEISEYENKPGIIFNRGPYIKKIYIYDISEWEELINEEIEKAKIRQERREISIELLNTQKNRIKGLINQLNLEVEKAEKEYREIGDYNHLRWALGELKF